MSGKQISLARFASIMHTQLAIGMLDRTDNVARIKAVQAIVQTIAPIYEGRRTTNNKVFAELRRKINIALRFAAIQDAYLRNEISPEEYAAKLKEARDFVAEIEN